MLQALSWPSLSMCCKDLESVSGDHVADYHSCCRFRTGGHRVADYHSFLTLHVVTALLLCYLKTGRLSHHLHPLHFITPELRMHSP